MKGLQSGVLHRVAASMLEERLVRQYLAVTPEGLSPGFPGKLTMAVVAEVMEVARTCGLTLTQLIEAAFISLPGVGVAGFDADRSALLDLGGQGAVRVRVLRARSASDYWVELVDVRELARSELIEERLAAVERKLAALSLGAFELEG